MNSPSLPLILLDPYPRAIDLIFDPATKAKLEGLGEIWSWMEQMEVSDLELILKGEEPSHCQRARWETVAKVRSKPAEQI